MLFVTISRGGHRPGITSKTWMAFNLFSHKNNKKNIPSIFQLFIFIWHYQALEKTLFRYFFLSNLDLCKFNKTFPLDAFD